MVTCFRKTILFHTYIVYQSLHRIFRIYLSISSSAVYATRAKCESIVQFASTHTLFHFCLFYFCFNLFVFVLLSAFCTSLYFSSFTMKNFTSTLIADVSNSLAATGAVAVGQLSTQTYIHTHIFPALCIHARISSFILYIHMYICASFYLCSSCTLRILMVISSLYLCVYLKPYRKIAKINCEN